MLYLAAQTVLTKRRTRVFFRVPAIITRSNAKKRALSIERKATWLSSIGREYLGADISQFHRVCVDRFISGLSKCTVNHGDRF